MFDINKASDNQKYIYSQLTPHEKMMVDKGFVNIDSYAPSFSAPTNEPSPSAPTPQEPKDEGSFFGNLYDASTGTGYQTLGQLSNLATDAMAAGSDQKTRDILSALTGAQALRAEGDERLQNVEDYRKANDIQHGWSGGVKGMALDLAQNPDSAAGLAGGLLAKTGLGTLAGEALIAVPTGRVFLNKYYSLVDKGVPVEEALARASTEAGIEFGTENISFGGVGGKLTKPLVTSTAAKVAKSAGIEMGEEMLAEATQTGVDNLVVAAELGSKAGQDIAKQNEFTSLSDFASRVSYAGALGAVSGGALRSVTAPFETASEKTAWVDRVSDIVKAGQLATQKKFEDQTPTIDAKARFLPISQEAKTLDRQQQEDIAYQQKAAQDEAKKDSDYTLADQQRNVVPGTLGEKLAPVLKDLNLQPSQGTLKNPDQNLLDEAALARKLGENEVKKKADDLAKRQQQAMNTARAKHVKAREEQSKLLRTQMVEKGLEDSFYVEGMKAWNKKNTLPSQEEVNALVAKQDAEKAAKKEQPKGKKPTKKASVTSQMKSLSSDEEDVANQIKAAATKPAATTKAAPVRDIKKTIRAQAKRMAPREMNSMLDAFESGRLQILPSDQAFGKSGETLGNSNGKYDGKVMYINQDKLDKGMSLMDIAHHEVDHYYKHSDKIDNEEVKRFFAGRADTPDTIAKIEKLSKNRHPVAMRAVKQAQKKAEEAKNPKLYNEEVVAYFHQYAKEAARKKMLGSARGAYEDLRSQLKDSTIGSKIFGKLDEVKDTGYVSRKRLENVGNLSSSKGNIPSLESFGGEGATGFYKALRDDMVWEGTDGKKRFYFSDDSAHFNTNVWAKMDVAKKNDKNGPHVPLVEILDHPELYKQYPAFKYIPVYKYFDDSSSAAGGYMSPGTTKSQDSIWLNSKYHGDTIASQKANILTMLHENQHAIQREEGFAFGTSPSYEAKEVRRLVVNKLAYRMAESYKLRNDFINMMEDEFGDQFGEKANGVINHLRGTPNFNTIAAVLDELLPNFAKAPNAVEFPEIDEYVGADDVGRERYYDFSGERESRLVEAMHNDAPHTRGLTPRQNYKYHVQQAGEIVSTENGRVATPNSAESFRSKGEGEMYHGAYEMWAEHLSGEDQDTIEALRQRIDKARSETGIPPSWLRRQSRELEFYDWASKVTKRYLDKYAGTPEDPLNDLVLPNGERWEDVMDSSVHEGMKGSTTGYRHKRLFTPAGTGSRAILDYLQHVGDYTMARHMNDHNFKLQQYDLVRAVKETKRADEEAKKKADKLRASRAETANKGVITYRAYKDGSKWVRLTKPGQFAAESDIMGHSVRGYEPVKVRTYSPRELALLRDNPDEFYKIQTNDNPHEDWIPESGEGGYAQYGHGGWEAIKSGRAEIYSLRDKNGVSHVTIEAENFTKGHPQYGLGSTEGKTITQIKGKGNERPSDKYIPYVQDFILEYQPDDIDEHGQYWGSWDYPRTTYGGGVAKVNGKYAYKPGPDGDISDANLPEADTSAPSISKAQDSLSSDDVIDHTPEDYESPTRARARKLWEGAKSLLSTKANYGREVREAMERAGAYSGEYQLLGEAGFNDMTRALDEAAVENPNYNWPEFFDKLEANPDAEQRERMVNAMGREFPEVARTYRIFRDQIDQFTDRILMERAKTLDTNPLTPDEVNLYKSLIENKGRYNTRSYMLSKGKTGKTYGKNVWRAYKEGDPDNLTPNDEVGYNRVANALEFLNDSLRIPEELPENRNNLEDLYSAWFTHRGGETAEFMREQLEKKRDILKDEEVEANALRQVRGILGIDEAKAGTYAARVAGMSRDNTIMMQRKAVPKALRELMGEVDSKEQPLKMMLTLAAQANYVARTRFLADMAMQKDMVIPADQRFQSGNEKYTVPLNGRQWGPLDGYYATPMAADLLEEHQTVSGSFGNALKMVSRNPTLAGEGFGVAAWNAWGRVAGLNKGLQIMGNPTNYIFNMGGNLANLARAGNVNPKYMGRAIDSARELIGSKSLTAVSDDTRKMLRTGMTDSAQVGELRMEAVDLLRDAMMEQTNPDSKTYAIKKHLRQKSATVKEVYAMTDIVSKMANYMYYEDQLREFYEAEGKDVSEEELEKEVSDYMKDENVTFLRAPPWLKVLESRGLTRFGTYIGETFRTQMWNYRHLYQELERAKNAETPEGRKKMLEIAGRRAVGSLGGLAAITSGLAAMASAGDDDKEKGFKKFLPDYAKIGAPIILGKNKAGNPLTLSLSRFDPVGPAIDIIRAAQNGELKDIEDIKKTIADYYISPALAPQLYKFATAKTDKQKEQAFNAIWQAFLPSGVVNWFKYDYPQGDGLRENVGRAVRLAGGRLDEANPTKALHFASQDFNSAVRTGRDNVFNSMAQGKVNDTVDTIQKARAVELHAFSELVDMDKGLILMGKTPRQRRTMLTEAGLSADAAEAIIKGSYKGNSLSYLLNWDSVKAHAKTEKLMDPVDYPQTRANLMEVRKKLEQLGYRFKK